MLDNFVHVYRCFYRCHKYSKDKKKLSSQSRSLNWLHKQLVDNNRWRIKGGGAPGTSAPSRSNFFHFDAVLGKYLAKQECIPVGCVPPALPPGTRHPLGPGTPRNQTPLVPGTPPHVNRITDTCKNITFPQLRLRAVIIAFWPKFKG